MRIIENEVRMRPGDPFYCMLVMEPEMDSNLIWIWPLTWLGQPCWPSKVMAKEEDVQRLPWWVLLLLGASSHLGQGLKDEKHVHDDDVAPDKNNDNMSQLFGGLIDMILRSN